VIMEARGIIAAMYRINPSDPPHALYNIKEWKK